MAVDRGWCQVNLSNPVKDEGKVAETMAYRMMVSLMSHSCQTGNVCGPVWTGLASDSCTVDPSRIIGEDRAI